MWKSVLTEPASQFSIRDYEEKGDCEVGYTPGMSLIEELKRRRVFRVAGVYGVTAWIITEVSATVLPALMLPEKLLTAIVVLLILGFPIAMVLAWVFDINPEGIQRTPTPSTTGVERVSRKFFNVVLLLITTLALGAFFFWRLNAQESAIRDSIAVLPFINLSSEEGSDYFSDGMSEELLNLLTRVPGLKVAARTSSFAYKGRDTDIRTIGRELGVATVLEGSVRWSSTEQRVRVTAQLIDTNSGYHLWSETYDRKLTDIFAMQDEISRAIVGKLKMQLDRVDEEAPQAGMAPPTRDMEAYRLYLKGRSLWVQGKEGAIKESIELFQEAVSRDPGFARAYANLAAAFVLLPDYSGDPSGPLYAQAMEVALKALSIDEKLADAHAVLARISHGEWAWSDAESGFYFAVSLNPSEPLPHYWYAQHLASVGRLKSAAAEHQIVAELLSETHPESSLVKLHQNSQVESFSAAVLAGNMDEAFQLAGNLVVSQQLPLLQIWTPPFAEFRRDERFTHLLIDTGLVDYWRRYGYPDACEAAPSDLLCG